MAKELPDRVVRKDKELQASEIALGELRFNWTKNEGVSMSSYARAVGLTESTIRAYVNAYNLWLDRDVQGINSWSDCLAMAYMSEQRREITKAVVAATPDVTMASLRYGDTPSAVAANKAISRINNRINEAKAKGEAVDIGAEIEVGIRNVDMQAAIDEVKAGQKAREAARRKKAGFKEAVKLQSMTRDLMRFAQSWEVDGWSDDAIEIIGKRIKNLASAVKMLDRSVNGTEIDWDDALAKLVSEDV